MIIEQQEAEEGGPRNCVIVGVLAREQIKEMKREARWPVEFNVEEEPRIVRGGTELRESEGEGEDSDTES